MIDTIHREADLPELPPEDWRRALELAMLWEWGIYRHHPWAIRLTPVAGPVPAPGLMANTEWMMSVITAQGLSPDAALEIITVLSAYTSGMALQAMQAAVEETELGLDAEHWWRSKDPEFARLAAQGSFPVMFSVSGPPDVDKVFTLGMERLLDGLTPLIAPGADRRRGRSGARAG
nr:TetR/AcrR family transcriptional regulator C-terminal domain-containing protein [Nonomuraea diastatica]